MQELFKGYEDRQCNDCVFCQKHKDKMRCDLFIIPYFVWGEYVYRESRSGWSKQGMKLSPAECWGYCGDMQVVRERMQDIKAYASLKKPKKEAV
jgi:hypothetical protein